MTTPEDKNVRAVQELLAERARVGLLKYGVTTERGDFTRLQWLRHAQAEMLDGAVYLQRLISDEEKALEPQENIVEHLSRIIPYGDKCHGCPKGDPHGIEGYTGDIFCNLMEEVMPNGDKDCGINMDEP